MSGVEILTYSLVGVASAFSGGVMIASCLGLKCEAKQEEADTGQEESVQISLREPQCQLPQYQFTQQLSDPTDLPPQYDELVTEKSEAAMRLT